MIENTSKRDPTLYLLGAMNEGNSGYIEGMEAAGQRQLVAEAELMPTEGPWCELIAMGFGKPEPSDDPLFVRTTLPAGWTKVATDHSMHSSVTDQRGVERVGVFYKAAFYDRRANCRLTNVGAQLANRAIYGEGPAGRPDKWGVLTEGERADYLASLDDYLGQAEEYPDICDDRVERVRALQAAAAAT